MFVNLLEKSPTVNMECENRSLDPPDFFFLGRRISVCWGPFIYIRPPTELEILPGNLFPGNRELMGTENPQELH